MAKINKNDFDQPICQKEPSEKENLFLGSSLPEIIHLIVTGNADLDEVVDKVLKSILELLQAAGGLVYVVDYQKKYLRLAHSVAISPKVINSLKQMDFSEGLTGQVFHQKEIHFVKNIYRNKNITKKISQDILNCICQKLII